MQKTSDIPRECGKGWWPLIERVTTVIDSYNASHPESPVEVSQIKEKFGGLRIYHYNAPEGIRQLIDDAVAKASRTCERCGATEGVTTGTDGVLLTLCPSCRKGLRPRLIKKTINDNEIRKSTTNSSGQGPQ